MALPYIRKINRWFYSAFEYMTAREHFAAMGYENFPYFFRRLYGFFYANKRTGTRPHDGQMSLKSLLGPFQPFVEMAKDVADTFSFRAYKTIWPHAIKDLLQPLRGVGNILKALATIAALPLFLVIGTIDAFIPFKSDELKPHYPLSARLINVAAQLLWVPHAISTFIRGITQIIFTPLAWIKVIMRAGITAYNGRQKIQDDRGIRQLLEETKKAESVAVAANPRDVNITYAVNKDVYLQSVDDELRRKCKKAFAQGRQLPGALVDLLNSEPAAQPHDESAPPVEKTDPLPKPETDYRFITFFRTAIAEKSGPKVAADLESQSDSSQAQEDEPLLGNQKNFL